MSGRGRVHLTGNARRPRRWQERGCMRRWGHGVAFGTSYAHASSATHTRRQGRQVAGNERVISPCSNRCELFPNAHHGTASSRARMFHALSASNDGVPYRARHREMDRPMHRGLNRLLGRHDDRRAHRDAHRRVHRRVNRHTNRRADRHGNRNAERYARRVFDERTHRRAQSYDIRLQVVRAYQR